MKICKSLDFQVVDITGYSPYGDLANTWDATTQALNAKCKQIFL
jgi:hypothetical protein